MIWQPRLFPEVPRTSEPIQGTATAGEDFLQDALRASERPGRPGWLLDFSDADYSGSLLQAARAIWDLRQTKHSSREMLALYKRIRSGDFAR
jgi:hypothetical protein